MSSAFDDDFRERGFLSDAIRNLVAGYRTDSDDWFRLTNDLSEALQAIAFSCTELCHGVPFERDSMAAFLMLRGVQTYQGAIIMAERGMVTEARILVRSLLEDTFCAAGLHDNADDMLKMIRDDHDASRKGRAKVILANGIGGADSRKLNELVAEIQGANYFSPEKAAKLGPLQKQYILYKQISDDAAHPSANSLKRHMHIHSLGWMYQWGPSSQGDIEETLSAAILCAMPLGIAVTQMLSLTELNSRLGDLSDRYMVLASSKRKAGSS
ncbi:DUF5677 domain-containing protein [Caulobacter segnis]